jgi:acid phosphatase (class A)
MSRWFGPVVFAVALLTLATPASAEKYYLTNDRPDGVVLLAPPPTPGSEEQAADLATVRQMFKTRTPEETKRAMKDATLSIFNFAEVIGPEFKEGRFPKMEALFAKVKNDAHDYIYTPKNYWKRQRPYQVDPALTFGEPEPSPSYPSGHSSWGMVQALMLADLFPDKSKGILEFGRQIGWDRVLIGKHFPTDVQAGRVLAQAIVRELKASPAFQRDFAQAKAEVQGQLTAKNAFKK